MKIPIAKPYFTKDDYAAMRGPLDSGWVAQGPAVAAFESAFAARAGARYAAAVTSCTAAMHLALAALGVGPGDEVIVPSFTFVATASAVAMCGARPVFCDVLPHTYNMDPGDAARRVTPRTRAIMPVHLFGLCADMDPIMKLARKHNLFVVEDAACAVGSLYKGKHAGTFGHAGCFSFHARKIITTGEGGMLLVRNKSIHELAKKMRTHGAGASAVDRHRAGGALLPPYDIPGFNYRMTDIQAALGLSQLKKLDNILKLRRAKAAYYFKHLANIDGVTLPHVPENFEHTFQSFVVTLDETLPRDRIGAAIERRGIAVRQGNHAVHTLGVYKNKCGHKPGDYPVSLRLSRATLALPLFPELTRDQQCYVVENFKDIIRKHG